MAKSDRHLPAKQNHGSYLLHRCGKTRSELCSLFGVADREISRYLGGTRCPGAKRRERIEAELGIPVASWDQPPPEVETSEVEIPLRVGSSTDEARARQLRVLIDAQLADLSTSNASAEQKAKLTSSLSQAIRNIGILTGESNSISQVKILKSSHWLNIQGALVECLEPFPEALDAVIDTLAQLSLDRPPTGQDA